MREVLVIFASMTDANKIKFYIERKYGINSKVVQTPKAVSPDGCSYSLIVERKELGKVYDAMKALGVMSNAALYAGDYSRVR